MTKVSVDNQISELDSKRFNNVEDVVNSLLRELPPNRIVTEISLDGHNVAKSVGHGLQTVLSEVKDLQIKTADKAIWQATGLDIAISCVESVQRTLIRASELFRESDKARANAMFAHCTDGLERFLDAVTITRCALNLDFHQVNTENGTLANAEQELGTILSELLITQEKSDFEALADKLEYELIPHLTTWNRVLRQLRHNRESN